MFQQPFWRVAAAFAPGRKTHHPGSVKIHIFQDITRQYPTMYPAINILIFHKKSCDTWTCWPNMPKKEARLFCRKMKNFLISSG
ncbi:MAG: hypothetical protein IKX21_04505, partial [Deltaproteobacteria bacterium]|nr:hypothetical protein [Deltaproteobacteria bacterium]